MRSGSQPQLTARQKHLRECFVVAEEGADQKAIEKAIQTMPDYFADYDTVVHFITEEELKRDHAGMPHGGFVIRSGETGGGEKQVVEFSLKLESNPAFTASVLTAYPGPSGGWPKKARLAPAPCWISPLPAQPQDRGPAAPGTALSLSPAGFGKSRFFPLLLFSGGFP